MDQLHLVVNKEFFKNNLNPCWLLKNFCFTDPVQGTNSVHRKVRERYIFLYLYDSVSCSNSETFSRH
jgi:hypothetical protein